MIATWNWHRSDWNEAEEAGHKCRHVPSRRQHRKAWVSNHWRHWHAHQTQSKSWRRGTIRRRKRSASSCCHSSRPRSGRRPDAAGSSGCSSDRSWPRASSLCAKSGRALSLSRCSRPAVSLALRGLVGRRTSVVWFCPSSLAADIPRCNRISTAPLIRS